MLLFGLNVVVSNFVDNFQEVLSVLIFNHRLSQLPHLVGIDPATTICNTLETSNLETLTLLYHFDKDRCLGQRVVCTCVEPSKAPSERLHLELSIGKELLIDTCYFEFATCRWLDVLGNIYNSVGIEI